MSKMLLALLLCLPSCTAPDDAKPLCNELECFSVKCPDDASPDECLCYPDRESDPIACEDRP